MKYLTVGVLGHVDHGKTALVKALTGVDTDRLKEERERGISIVLGFADLVLPGGRVAFVDAPGHERFVRTMVSGATGIGAAMLVVSAAEGVKPQTIEHLDIAHLLSVDTGLVVLTQCDRASAQDIARAEAAIGQLLADSFLANRRIVRTSAVTGQGLDELRTELERLLERSVPLPDEGPAYLPVDRVFSMAGAGTVVTGTLRRGSLAEGEELEIYPRGARAVVRQVQSHGVRTERALPGTRTAVNLRGIPKNAIAHGDALAPPATLRVAPFADVEISVLPREAQPLRNRQRVRVLFGTSELFGRVHYCDTRVAEPGASALAQIHFESPAVVLVNEPFILRSCSPVRTIGGGRFLGVTQNRRRRDSGLSVLQLLAQRRVQDILALRCREAAPGAVDLRKFSIAERFPLAAVVAAAGSDDFVRPDDCAVALRLPPEGPTAPSPAHDDHTIDIAVEIAEHFLKSGFEPPALTDVVGRDKDRNRAYRSLVNAGTLVVLHVPHKPHTLANTIVFHRNAIERAQHLLNERFGAEGAFQTGDAKEILGASRKYLIPLLEYLDACGFTRRVGDLRRLTSAGHTAI